MNNRLSPGSKNWIPKFFELVEKGIISLDSEFFQNDEKDLTHFVSHKTGLIYGNAHCFLFSNELDSSKFTQDERLKLLLFETLLFAYLRKFPDSFKKESFLENLNDFYGEEKDTGVFSWFNEVFRNNTALYLEGVISNRVQVKSHFLGANFWLHHLSNATIFLDVVLYRSFLDGKVPSFSNHLESYTTSLMNGAIFAAYTDNNLDDKEQRVLEHFLVSTFQDKTTKKKFEKRITTGVPLKLVKKESVPYKMLSQFTFELGLFLIQLSHQPTDIEIEKLNALANALQLTEKEVEESIEMCSAYMLQNQKDLLQYQTASETSFVFKAFSKRWIRIIGRNKDKLVQEMRESKELLSLIQKATKEDLNPAEKERVKAQFMDLIKTMPSIAIFLLPGGTLLLPLILKLVPELVPSAFKENEIDQEKKKT